MRKQVAWLLLFATLLFLLTGCGQGNETGSGEQDSQTQASSETTNNTGMETGMDVETQNTQSKITDFLTIYGRVPVKNNALQLFWTNSGFSMNFKGTGVTAKLTPSNTNAAFYGFLCVYIDGSFEPVNTICVNKAGTYTLAADLTPGVHTIEVRKRNEADYGGSASIEVSKLAVKDGAFVVKAPDKKDFLIEFIGDSITSGFGNMVSDGSGPSFRTDVEDGTMTYAALAAKALRSEYHMLSRSGIGFLKNATCDSIYDYYTKTASLPRNELNGTAWDFAANPADVVVINLGTNDGGAKKANGQAFTDSEFTDYAVELIHLVRENNPNATILWAYGLMGTGKANQLKAAVDRVNKDGDNNVFFMKLDPLKSSTEGLGLHGHPTIQTDIRCAVELATVISDLTGQDMDFSVIRDAQVYYAKTFWSKLDGYTKPTVAKLKETIEAAVKLTGANNDAYLAAQKAIFEAYLGLATMEDVSDEYIVVDSCDSIKGWSIGGKSSLDTEEHIAGEGCLATTGNGNIYFIKNPGNYQIEMPENWQNWYLECWLYVSDASAVSGGSAVEISQVVDNIEVEWSMQSLGLKDGWNHLQLKFGTGGKSAPDQFETLQNLRFFLFLTDTIDYKLDDVVISRGKFAANTSELDQLLEEASMVSNPGSSLKEAIAFAKEATSQRNVDLAVERLQKALDA